MLWKFVDVPEILCNHVMYMFAYTCVRTRVFGALFRSEQAMHAPVGGGGGETLTEIY